MCMRHECIMQGGVSLRFAHTSWTLLQAYDLAGCTKIQAITGETISGNDLLDYLSLTMHNYLCITPFLTCTGP
jgi:hypothetical protein